MIRHTLFPVATAAHRLPEVVRHDLTQREVLLFLGVSLALAAAVVFYLAVMDLMKDYNERNRDHG